MTSAASDEIRNMLGGPVLLSADRFTPLSKTPWAGLEIGRSFKESVLPSSVGERIGESWEFSCDPTFPSFLRGTRLTLSELVRAWPEDVLSPALAARGYASCEILVKLLNADEPLSLQIHPKDDDPDLKKDECGKPESWLVLSAKPGAGLYLGFSKAVTRRDLEKALGSGEDVSHLLQFVPVKTGDFFEIEPGTPHAVGPGIVLLEPQRIVFGKSGKTYRLWDWGRRYDTSGRLDLAHGAPRELHLAAGLRLADPEEQVGDAFVNKTRRRAEVLSPAPGIELHRYPANPYYQLERVHAFREARLRLHVEDGYGALVMLSGRVEAKGKAGVSATLTKGQPALLPHACFPLELAASDDADFAVVRPAGSRLSWL